MTTVDIPERYMQLTTHDYVKSLDWGFSSHLFNHDFSQNFMQYEIQASFLEIYSETIRDLLGNPDSKHEIKQVTTNNGKQANDVFVTNLKAVAVTSSDQVSSILFRHRPKSLRGRTKGCNTCAQARFFLKRFFTSVFWNLRLWSELSVLL